MRNDRVAHINRLKGFKDECRGREDIRTIIPQSQMDLGTLERAYTVTSYLLSTDFNPDGIIAVNDHAAMGVMKACAEKGLKIPDDIRVIGFDDLSYSRLPNIDLTSVAPGKEELIHQAMGLVIRMVEKGIVEERGLVTPKLMRRGTTSI